MSTNLETLEGAWSANPGGLMFAQYAEALHREGRTRDAQAILADGLARWPKHLSGRLLKGRLAMDVGDLESARAAFQEAVDQDNNSPAALRSLAMVLGKQQYQRQAIDLWVRLSLLDPDNPDAAATARRMIADLETTSSLADLGLGIRDTEDAASREALSEGASSGISPKGLSGIDADSPLAGWNSDAPLASDPAFDLGDLAFPTPPSVATPSAGQSTANWTPGAGLDSGHHQTIADAATEMESAKPLLGPSDDSGFATLEMAAFPEKSIPPPPLELPKPRLAAGNDSDTRIMAPVPPLPSPAPTEILSEPAPEVTQFMPRPTAPSAPVTGDDIGARLDALFAEPDLPEPELPGAALAIPQVELPPSPPAPASRPGSAVDTPTRVSGEDIEDRLSELLGSPSETAELVAPVFDPPPAPTRSSATPKAAVTGNDIEARLDDLFGASEVDLPVMDVQDVPEPPSAPASLPPSASPSAAVSGRDIEDRLDSLFGDESEVRSDTLKASETSAMDRDSLLADPPSEGAEATLESMRAFETAAAPMFHGLSKRPDETVTLDNFSNPSSSDTAAERLVAGLDPSDVDSGGSTLDLPTVGDLPSVPPPAGPSGRLTGQDLDSQLDELFASSEFLLDDASPPPQKTPSPAGGPVTGDDIGDRLDDLFGSDSDFPAGVPTVTLAEEYLRQGYRDQALAVYRQLASRDPANTELARRIAEIEAAGT